MLNSRKIAPLVVGAFVLALIVPASLAFAQDDPVNLRFSYWRMATEPQATIMNEIIAEFETENPHISIEVEPTPQGSVVDVVTTQILAGSPPDVFVISHTDVPRFVAMQGLQPIDEYLDADPEFTSALIPQGIQLNTVDGTAYCLPHAFGSNALFYNRDLFERAGLPDRAPRDAEEFIEFGRAIDALGPDIHAFALFGGMDVGTDVRFFELFWALGVDAILPQEGIVNIDTPEGIEAFQFIVDLHRVHGITTPNPTEINYPTVLRLFTNGNLGMFQANVGSIAPIEDQAPNLRFSVAPLKWTEVGAKIDGAGFCIARGSQHPEEAWLFVRHVMGFEAIRDWSIPLSYLPPRQDVAELPGIQENPYLKIYFEDIIPYSKPTPASLEFGELMEIARRELAVALLGQKTAEEAARDAGEAMRAVLAR